MWRHIPTVFGGRPPLPAELPQHPASDPEDVPPPALVPVPVPDLVGLSSTDARRLARAARLAVMAQERHSSHGLWGRVLEQDPAPGTLAGPDGSVIITVGARPKVAVPDIRGRDEDDALSMLREAGLGADRRAARRSDRVPEGHVVRTRPRAGTEVATGTRISYVVAAAPRDVVHGSHKRDRRSKRVARMSDGSFLRPG